MNLREWNQEQIKEALSDDNKWFFAQKYGRQPANANELILYYIENGGSKGFAERKAQQRYEATDETPPPTTQ